MAGVPTILLVDDSSTNVEVRAQLLRQFGCEVVTANDKDTAVNAAAGKDFDLAIIDYHLSGGVTGDEVALSLGNLRPKLRLVMLTGDPTIPDSAQATVHATLIKGSGPGELCATIERLLPDKPLKPRRPMLISPPKKAS